SDVRQLGSCCDRVLDIACASNRQCARFDLLLACRHLDWFVKIITAVDSRIRVANDPDPTDVWRDLLEQFQPLLPNRGFKIGESRQVSVRMCETHRKTASNRVSYAHEDDWDCAGLGKNGGCRRSSCGEDHVGLESDEFLGKLASVCEVESVKVLLKSNV